MHPTNIIQGYKLAAKEACRYLQDKMAIPVKELGVECLAQAAKTSMSSKLIGPECELFSKLADDAVLACKTVSSIGDEK